MPKSLTHAFVNSNPDDATSPTLTRPSNWNADHNFWLGQRVVSTIATDTILQTDHFSWIYYNVATAIAADLPAPSSGNFQLGWTTKIKSVGAGAVTLTPTGGATFNGSSAVIPLFQGDAAEIFSEGSNDYIVLVFRAAALLGNDGKGGRLLYVSATALSYLPLNGGFIRLNGVLRPIPATGNGVAGLANTGVYVGGVAAQNLVANTTYYVFAFDPGNGTLTADFWTQAAATHGPSATPGNIGTEVKFVSGAEDATRTLLGMVHTNASSQFQEDGASIFGVATWQNRRLRQLPGNQSGTVTGIGTTTPVAYNTLLTTLGWGDAPPLITINALATNNTVGSNTDVQVALDGGVVGLVPLTPRIYGNGQLLYYESISAMAINSASEGWHGYNLAAWVSGGSGNVNASIYGQALI